MGRQKLKQCICDIHLEYIKTFYINLSRQVKLIKHLKGEKLKKCSDVAGKLF